MLNKEMPNKQKNKQFVIYQITNKITHQIYIGAHATFNLKDNYMGSSKYLKQDIKLLGRENFHKDILFIFDNKESMIAKEGELVDRNFCHRIDTYNKMIGGIPTILWDEMATVKDKDDNSFKVYIDDPRYLSGELVGITKGFLAVKDKDENTFQVSINDARYLSGELISVACDIVTVKDKDGNIFSVATDDPRYLSGELVGVNKNTVVVKDKSGNRLQVDINDSRYLSGELVGHTKDIKHNELTKQKIGEANSVKQKGELNSQFGTCWITNNTENKKIKKIELEKYFALGWIKGRKIFL